MKICPNKKKNLQLEAVPGTLARVAPASSEAGAIDINFDTAKKLPKTLITSPQNSSGTMGRGDAAKTRGNKEKTPKARPKAPAKASPTAAPVVTPAKPTRSSPRGRTAADGELDRIAAMNRANAEEKRARGTDEAGKGGERQQGRRGMRRPRSRPQQGRGRRRRVAMTAAAATAAAATAWRWRRPQRPARTRTLPARPGSAERRALARGRCGTRSWRREQSPWK